MDETADDPDEEEEEDEDEGFGDESLINQSTLSVSEHLSTFNNPPADSEDEREEVRMCSIV